MSFTALKKNASSTLAKLAEAAKAGSKSYEDTRFWTPTRDKAGSGSAVIRFLPCREGEDLPYVKTYRRSFKGPTGKWYVNECLTTLKQNDPVGDYAKVLWDSGNEDGARAIKRKLSYISNIYVVNDPANPDNNGKVFLFKYGVKIFAKLEDKMTPEFEDIKPMNPFDFWTGANFRLRIAQVGGFPNYDKSEFDPSSEFLSGNDAELEKVYNSLYSLKEFVDPANTKLFKTYADLEAKFKAVMGDQIALPPATTATAEADQETSHAAPSAPAAEAKPVQAARAPIDDDEDDDDAQKAFFARLGKQ